MLLEQPGDPLGVVVVHLAAERAQEVRPWPRRLSNCPPAAVSYLAYSTARLSRMTVTRIVPG